MTTPEGDFFTADTDVRLASLWADAQLGASWDDGLPPFDQHDVMNDMIDEIHAMQDGEIPGYTVTESHPRTTVAFTYRSTWRRRLGALRPLD